MWNIFTDEDLRRAAVHLHQLIDEDPARAIVEARQLRGKGPTKRSVQTLRAGILIDAGGHAGGRLAVKEGIKILLRLESRIPDEPMLRYNRANGLSQLAKLDVYSSPNWYTGTHSQRREARRLYHEVATSSTASAELRAQALINLGNELDSGYRWVEAYDCWVQALQIDSSNAVATLNATRMLLRRLGEPTQNPSVVSRVAGYYARLADKNAAQVERFAGQKAAAMAKTLPTFRSSWKPRLPALPFSIFSMWLRGVRLDIVMTVLTVNYSLFPTTIFGVRIKLAMKMYKRGGTADMPSTAALARGQFSLSAAEIEQNLLFSLLQFQQDRR